MADTTRPTFTQVVSGMSAGEWHKLAGSDIPLLSKADHDALVAETGGSTFWGGSGSASVLKAWNSAGYDADGHRLFLFGGGRSDYGGNEVYQYDFDDMTWSRLTDPAPLTEQVSDKTWLPSEGPAAVHTYDGLAWNPVTGTLWLAAGNGAYSTESVTNAQARGLWEFDPDTTTWTRHDIPSEMRMASMIADPVTGDMVLVDHQTKPTGWLISPDGSVSQMTVTGSYAHTGIYGTTNGALDPSSGITYEIRDDGIWALSRDGATLDTVRVATLPDTMLLTEDAGAIGMAYDPTAGTFLLWGGDRDVWTWNPTDGSFGHLWNESSASAPGDLPGGTDNIFDKWVYLPDVDAFAGISDADGVWIYKRGEADPAADVADIGTVVVDPSTSGALGFFMPLQGGDHDYDANVHVQYRVAGSETGWSEAMDLTRLHPEMIGVETPTQHGLPMPEEGFAGSIFGLQAGTDYEVRFTLDDPDGGQSIDPDATQTVVVRTDAGPLTPEGGRTVAVSDADGLKAALADAQAGDIIELSGGVYQASDLTVGRGGYAGAPVVIRAADGADAVIDGMGSKAVLNITADYVQVDGLTLRNGGWGIDMRGVTGVDVINNHINGVDKGIDGRFGLRDAFISDNVLEGHVEFPRHDKAVWDYEGIVVAGQGVEVANNTLSGFGDALGLHKRTDAPNIGIEFHHNLVLWGGDDGIEMDFSTRNVSAHDNLLANTNNGISLQPVWGGPAYAFDNVLINQANRPFKLNNDPTGFKILNNTSINHDVGFKQYSGMATNFEVLNNLFLGGSTTNALDFTTKVGMAVFDHNGWNIDARFTLPSLLDGGGVRVGDFASWQASGVQGAHDVLLNGNPFAAYDFGTAPHETFRDAALVHVGLRPESAAVDAGIHIPNITDGYSGAAPDLGARELGSADEVYGARSGIDYRSAPMPDGPVAGTPSQPDDDTDGGGDTVPPPSSDSRFEGTDSRDTVDFSSRTTGMALHGNGGHDDLTATQGDDTLDGGVGKDILRGGAGNDLFLVGGNADIDTLIDGGDGSDTIQGTTGDDTIGLSKIAGIELLDGGDGHDVVLGTGYADTWDFSATAVRGIELFDLGAGHDRFTGSQGADIVRTGAGNDVLDGHGGQDTVVYDGAFADHDVVVHGDGSIVVSSGSGTDTLRSVEVLKFADGWFYDGAYQTAAPANAAPDQPSQPAPAPGPAVEITGTAWRDVIDASSETAPHLIHAEGGHDDVTGSHGNDTINGGAGKDILRGGSGDDLFLAGGNGDIDTLIDGGAGTDTLRGTAGDDVIGVNQIDGIEVIDGGDGADVIRGSSYRDVWNFSGVVLSGIETIDGGDGHDDITGSQGDDVIRGGAGSDRIDGQGGADIALYDDTFSAYAVRVAADGAIVVAGGDGTDTVTGIETLRFADGAFVDGRFIPDVPPYEAVADAVTVAPNTVLRLTAADLFGNDLGGGDGLTLDGIGAAETGVVHKIADGSLLYVAPAAGGSDAFTYTASIGGISSTATVGLTTGAETGAVTSGTRWGDTLDLNGATTRQVIEAGDGHDKVYGGEAGDLIDGGVGHDTLFGNGGDDVFRMAQGDLQVDRVYGGDGFDVIAGTGGDDVFALTVLDSVEMIAGGAGHDVIVGSAWRDVIDLRGVILDSIEAIDGGAGHDILFGSLGNDVMLGGAGNDILDGADGHDIAVFGGTFGEYAVSTRGDQLLVSGLGETDTLFNIEELHFADRVVSTSDFWA